MIQQKGYWNIKNADGDVVNTIIASEDFVEENFDHYEFVLLPITEAEARTWRNQELAKTDEFAKLPDYPHHAILLEYRQALRDWPSTVDFPDTVPESLESRIENAP